MALNYTLHATVLVAFFSVGLALKGLLSIGIALLILHLDLRRRHFSRTQSSRRQILAGLDLVPPPLAAGLVTGLLSGMITLGPLPLHSPPVLVLLSSLLAFPLLWSEGRRQIQIQRPTGLVFAEGLVAFGVSWLLIPRGGVSTLLGLLLTLAGVLLTVAIVPAFYRKYEGLRILDRVADEEQFPQPEYAPATAECPRPELWTMLDSQSTELEVLGFLKSIVITIKPRLILETGTFLGHGTIKLAEGIRENGFGKVITVEADPVIRARAQKRFQEAGLSEWIESRLESSLETNVDGTIDLFYSDSHLANREAEIRRLLPKLDPRGLLVIHDASSHFKVVREAALRLEQEGLISVVMLPTPRGVVVAQRREGRK